MAYRSSTGLKQRVAGTIEDQNLITNGAFTSGTTSWTATDSTLASVAGGEDGNCLQITETGSANPGKAYQDITTVVGRTYCLDFYFKLGTSSAGYVTVGTTGDDDAIFVGRDLTDADWTQHRAIFTATATTTRIVLLTKDPTATETSLFDTVMVYPFQHGFREIFKDCFLNIYTGSQPTSADDAATGTLLVTIYSDGASAGLEWDEPVAGVLSKKSTETWSGTAVASGTAGWFRVYEAGDTPSGSSTVKARMDGSVALSGAQLNMSTTTAITSGAVSTLNTFQIDVMQSS